MKIDRPLLAALAAVAALAGPAGAVQVAGPNADVTAVVDAALSAGQRGDVAAMRAQYAQDCAFVDEFAPFLWTGPNAIDRYFASAGQTYQETRHTADKVAAGPAAFVYVSGDRAFVVEPVSGTASIRGKPYAAKGAFAFTLARIDGHWKITSQTWTKASESANPY
jgi:ketosteroid isomerase-like protein